MAAVQRKAYQKEVFQSVFKPDKQSDRNPSTSAQVPSKINNSEAETDTSATKIQSQRVKAFRYVAAALRLNKAHPVFAVIETQIPPNFAQALNIVAEHDPQTKEACPQPCISEWFLKEMRSHFIHIMKPWLVTQSENEVEEALVKSTLDGLQWARKLYDDKSQPLRGEMMLMNMEAGKAFENSLEQEFKTLARSSIPDTTWDMIEWYLSQSIDTVLKGHKQTGSEQRAENIAARYDLESFVVNLTMSGLSGERFEIMIAEAMSASMTAYIQETYSGLWNISGRDGDGQNENNFFSSRRQSRRFSSEVSSAAVPPGLVPESFNQTYASKCVQDICMWIETRFATLADELLKTARCGTVSEDDKKTWKEMGIRRLADLRVTELYDIVVDWPNSQGALNDLRTAITTSQDRLRLTETFIQQLKARLLHAGASTLQILRTYIAMIHSFHSLDHSLVLLNRVSFPLQMYLLAREDTAKVIIEGLLADAKTVNARNFALDADRLNELAVALHNVSRARDEDDDDDEWLDLTWLPDPVDAGPGYKRSKKVDVIGTLIGVLSSKDVFCNEFQIILGEHLLLPRTEFSSEVAVLDLLKTRFGTEALQPHEVMMKDIHDSNHLDVIIRLKEKLNSNVSGVPLVRAKMLSRFFWPNIDDRQHNIPDIVAKQLGSYELGYEKLKKARKLAWRPTSGQALIELELKDRTFKKVVDIPQASVIYAFHQENEDDAPLERSYEWLQSTLNMDEALLTAALKYWVDEKILSQSSSDVFTVLESLDQDRKGSPSKKPNAQAGRKKEGTNAEHEALEKLWPFIQGMLKNSAKQMAPQMIGNMLKMTMGYAGSNEDLVDYLNDKCEQGFLKTTPKGYELVKPKPIKKEAT